MRGLEVADGAREVALAFRDVALQFLEFFRVGAEQESFEVVGEEAGAEFAGLDESVPMLDDCIEEGKLDGAFGFVLGEERGAEGLGGPGSGIGCG